jgi:glycosyltransferase involved in cell wall biosynthesis
LPHFLPHYTKLGIERFLCGLHGSHLAQAQQFLAGYPVEEASLSGSPHSTPIFSVILWAQPASPLAEVIASIQLQSFADWELIVLDNGLDAASQAVLEAAMQADKRIRLLAQTNESLTQVRQHAFDLAQGEIIYCLDANHLGLPDTLRRLYETLESQPTAVAAYGAVVGMSQSENPLDILAQLTGDHFLGRGAVAIRHAALVEALTLAETEIASGDQTLWWLLAANGPVAFVVGDPLSTVNRAPASRLVSPAQAAPATQPAFTQPAFLYPGGANTIKLAYLIVAHHQPNHLARLIRALDDEHSYFFIHIDDKVPLAPFQDVVPERPNIVFLTDRVAVEWGQFNVVQALLKLIHAAVACDQAFKYYTVLSGSDYPIKHKQEISARLQASDCQFLRIDRTLTAEPENSHRPFIKNLPHGKYYSELTPIMAACIGR